VALGQSWGDPVAGLAVAAFICHVGYEVTGEALSRELAEAGSFTWASRAVPV
jgi:divalent metal cation (Fe/Co/Zn/Cd) transporter